jgi:hypothetical protein
MGLPDNSDNCFDPAQLWSQVPQVWVHSKGQVIDFKNLFSMKIYISNLYTSVCTFTFPIYIHMCVCVCVCVCVYDREYPVNSSKLPGHQRLGFLKGSPFLYFPKDAILTAFISSHFPWSLIVIKHFLPWLFSKSKKSLKKSPMYLLC